MTPVQYICRYCGDKKIKYRTNERKSAKEWKYTDGQHPINGRICFPCSKRVCMDYRKATNNASVHKYEKTPKGFLVRLYRNMQSRVSGVQSLKAHLYLGKELLPREEFYLWASRSPEFLSMFKAWEDSGYSRKLTPSVDRIDSNLGYFLRNMRWLTHSENSRHGSLSKWNKHRAESIHEQTP